MFAISFYQFTISNKAMLFLIPDIVLCPISYPLRSLMYSTSRVNLWHRGALYKCVFVLELVLLSRQSETVDLEINAEKTKLWQSPSAEVSSFKYLGSYIQSTEADVKAEKAVAWKVLNSMSTVWKSHISDSLEQNLFQATVETVLLYSCETCALTSPLESSLNGCYTCMLRAVLNIKWWQHIPNIVWQPPKSWRQSCSKKDEHGRTLH